MSHISSYSIAYLTEHFVFLAELNKISFPCSYVQRCIAQHYELYSCYILSIISEASLQEAFVFSYSKNYISGTGFLCWLVASFSVSL